MDAVEDIKQRLNIEDVVGEYVQLKRAGRNWKGLSPFSNERTPSFMVSPEKQIWHDFSSGKGGNMFSFIMEMEGLDFKGALELLARKAGIDLEQYRSSSSSSRARNKEKERLYEALELAARFYQTQLKGNREALEYLLKKRQFSKQTVLEWRLGYSPNTGDALVKFLLQKNFTQNEIKLAGLSAQRYRGTGDMFRGRIMVPLADPQGRVIGFTARLLADDPDAPKYINTPQTPLYDKSRHVFGLHLAKEAIRKTKYVVVAEGNLDVIMSHQAGVRQMVATAGTALTEPHLKALGRFTGDIRLSFDADNAGLNATERAIPIAAKTNVSLSIVTVPSGKDPDELIRQSPGAWQEVIERPQYALDWLMDRYAGQLDLASAQGKRQFSDITLAVIRTLTDQVEQDHYLGVVAGKIGVSREALLAKLQGQTAAEAPRLKTPKVRPAMPDKAAADYKKVQDHLLSLAVLQPRLRVVLDGLMPEMFPEDDARLVLAFLRDHPDWDGRGADKAAKLKPASDYVKILGVIYEQLYQTVEPAELVYEAARLRDNLIDQYVKRQKHQLVARLDTAGEAETKAILEEVNKLNDLLRTVKGG